MKKFYLLFCTLSALLLRGPVAGAQSSEPFNPFSAFKASAETWSMSKYGDAKPSLYTGAMHYSVPIYTYQDPDFTLPVSLEYNFDGYRPSQHSGTVGLGWNLNCGGVITRDIRGFPDDDAVAGGSDRGFVGYYRTAHDGNGFVSDSLGNNVYWSIYCNTISTQTPSEEAAHGINPFSHVPVYVYTTFPAGVPKPSGTVNYDLTPDIYHFSIPGHSGDFMFMPDGSVRVFNSDLPYGEVKVEFTPYGPGSRTPGNTYYCTFTITTGEGTQYEFGETGTMIDYSKSTHTYSTSTMPSISATAFHLKRIVAPNGRTMEFQYSSAKQVSVSGSVSYTPRYFDGNYQKSSDIEYVKTFSYYSVPEAVSIDGKTLIEFGYADRTSDECAPAYFDYEPTSAQPVILDWVDILSPKRLSSITVYNNDEVIVERASLVQSYAPYGTPKMFLDAVSTLKGGCHSFDYDRNKTFPKNDRQETDHWGFWNGRFLSDIRDIVQFSGSRYNQMTGIQKEADVAFARAGAMTRIDYPAGGYTEIEYEGHIAEKGLDEESSIYPSEGTASIPVGGLRVKKLINHDGESASGDTTSFAYGGGFLYKMPRYLFSLSMTYNTASGPGSEGFTFYTTVTGYNADCDFSVSRDENIGYASVIQSHPDQSGTETVFSVYEPGWCDEYLDNTSLFPYRYLAKRGVLSDYDHINEQYCSSTAPMIAATPFIDRCNMRGRVLRETTKDANCNTVRDVQYSYVTDSVHLNQVWWNDLDQFDCSPWTCYSPMLERETVTDYADDGTALTTVHIKEYNAAGQLSSERISSPQCPSDTLNTYYAYYHETQEPYSFRALPGALRYSVSTRCTGGSEYMVAGEWRNYTAEWVHTQPSEIISYKFSRYPVAGEAHARVVYNLGAPESTTFTRDTLFRITRADLPGGAWVEYDWDGNNIIQVRENAQGNATSYRWKDLVGVTEITAPSGRKEGADYDSRNRLWRRKDTAGRITESYQYKLKNE